MVTMSRGAIAPPALPETTPGAIEMDEVKSARVTACPGMMFCSVCGKPLLHPRVGRIGHIVIDGDCSYIAQCDCGTVLMSETIIDALNLTIEERERLDELKLSIETQ